MMSEPNWALPELFACWTEEEKERQREAGQQLLQRLQQAIKRRQPVLKLEPGHYRFAKMADDTFTKPFLAIDGAGALFEGPIACGAMADRATIKR